MSELQRLLGERLNGDESAVVHDHGRWYGTADIRADIASVQQALREARILPGERVVLALPNSYEYIVAYLAALLHGAVVLPVNPRMPLPELARVLERAQPAGAWVAPDVWTGVAPFVGETSLRFAGELACQAGGRMAVTGVQGLSGRRLEPADLAVNPVAADDAAVLLFTSGTTGTPKGVALSHRQVLATANNVARSHLLTPADVTYCFLPLFHINAQVVALLSTLITGGRLVVEEKFSASRFWPTILEHGVTWVSAVPTVIAILIKAPDEPVVSKTLRFVRSASAPLPALHAHRFEARFGVPVIESYGLTEAASQVCVNPLPPGKRKIGSVGLPCGVELRVVDEAGEVLPAGEIGEIQIRGESVIRRYAYGDDNGSSFVDGWFRTGDLGYADDEGYVYITGRSKEMINRAGQKISPREVEEVIGRHAAVRSAAVIGLPHEVYGEQVVAYVIPEDDRWKTDASFDEAALKAELKALCLNNLSAYKCPAEFYFVEELPVGPTGKIQRTRLRQQVLASATSAR
ncbi:MAG: AMP-binding protein [Alicyclobacillaceae bacterium]|nr:AMP-binding protein [Alicyclobacillaceae bacterium]